MVYAQPRICPGAWHSQSPLGLWDTNGSPDLGQTTRPYNNQQKERTSGIVDFAVPADNRVELKECENKDKYLEFAWELKNCRTWVTVIPILIDALSTVTKGLVQGLEDLEITGRVETDGPNYYIIENDMNTEKSPGDLRRLAVTQTPVENHQLRWCEKLSRSKIIIILPIWVNYSWRTWFV